jgi:hypothetical protein
LRNNAASKGNLIVNSSSTANIVNNSVGGTNLSGFEVGNRGKPFSRIKKVRNYSMVHITDVTLEGIPDREEEEEVVYVEANSKLAVATKPIAEVTEVFKKKNLSSSIDNKATLLRDKLKDNSRNVTASINTSSMTKLSTINASNNDSNGSGVNNPNGVLNKRPKLKRTNKSIHNRSVIIEGNNDINIGNLNKDIKKKESSRKLAENYNKILKKEANSNNSNNSNSQLEHKITKVDILTKKDTNKIQNRTPLRGDTIKNDKKEKNTIDQTKKDFPSMKEVKESLKEALSKISVQGGQKNSKELVTNPKP